MRLDSVRLDSLRLDSARLDSARFAIGPFLVILAALLFLPSAKAAQDAQSVDHIDLEKQVQSPWGAYLAGRFADAIGDYDVAAALMEKALQDEVVSSSLENNSAQMRLTRRLFLSHLRAGNQPRATELASEILASGEPAGPAIAMVAGIEAMRQGDWVQTEAHFTDLPASSGLSRFARPILLAWAAAGQVTATEAEGSSNTRIEQAVEALDPLISEAGLDSMAALQAGLIYAHAGLFDKSVTALTARFETMNEAPSQFAVALSRTYRAMGKAEEAEALLRDYQAANPFNSRVSSELARLESLEGASQETSAVLTPLEAASDALYDLGTQFQRQSAEIALIYARFASFLNETYDLPYLLIANVLESQDRHEDAISTLQKLPETSTNFWDARLQIVNNYIASERMDEAIALLNDMAGERLDSPDPHYNLGYVYRVMEEYVDAAAAYDEAIARLGEDIQAHHWRLFYSRGIAHERAKLWDEAEPDFLKALELKPDDPDVLNYLGYSWVEMGRNIREAEEMIRKAVAQRQGSGYVVDSLGWVLYKIGEFEEAVVHLERAVQLRPHDSTINDHLGDAYWRVGRKLEARFQWERALNLEPEEEIAPLIEEKLKSGMGPPEIIPVSD